MKGPLPWAISKNDRQWEERNNEQNLSSIIKVFTSRLMHSGFYVSVISSVIIMAAIAWCVAIFHTPCTLGGANCICK